MKVHFSKWQCSDIRAICHNLYPATLKSLGLASSLRELARRCQNDSLQVRFATDKDLNGRSIPPQLAIAAYRIAQEATDNAMRHSGASKIDIRLGFADDCLAITVSDNGTGFDPTRATGGLGLTHMTNRVETFAGQLTVKTAPTGTTIEVHLPLTESEPL